VRKAIIDLAEKAKAGFHHEWDESDECQNSGFLIRAFSAIRGEKFLVLGLCSLRSFAADDQKVDGRSPSLTRRVGIGALKQVLDSDNPAYNYIAAIKRFTFLKDLDSTARSVCVYGLCLWIQKQNQLTPSV
jgi:hypothetical protein